MKKTCANCGIVKTCSVYTTADALGYGLSDKDKKKSLSKNMCGAWR